MDHYTIPEKRETVICRSLRIGAICSETKPSLKITTRCQQEDRHIAEAERQIRVNEIGHAASKDPRLPIENWKRTKQLSFVMNSKKRLPLVRLVRHARALAIERSERRRQIRASRNTATMEIFH